MYTRILYIMFKLTDFSLATCKLCAQANLVAINSGVETIYYVSSGHVFIHI